MKEPKKLLDKGIRILAKQISHLQKASKDSPLDAYQSRSLNECVRTLMMASKSLKDARKDQEDELQGLSDEELIRIAESALNKTKEGQ